MRRLPLAIFAALTLASGAAQAAPALMAPINQSVPINLPRGTRDVLIGNPAIADVNVLDSGKAVILGKGYGVTNIVVIDQLGRTVMNRQVVVAAPTGNVTVIRGAKSADYACATRCERADGAAPTADR
ncbi:MAG TPA: pilus assembly protein N-terminal domain-containing protein, partial [Phenylobacterium sp.]